MPHVGIDCWFIMTFCSLILMLGLLPWLYRESNVRYNVLFVFFVCFFFMKNCSCEYWFWFSTKAAFCFPNMIAEESLSPSTVLKCLSVQWSRNGGGLGLWEICWTSSTFALLRQILFWCFLAWFLMFGSANCVDNSRPVHRISFKLTCGFSAQKVHGSLFIKRAGTDVLPLYRSGIGSIQGNCWLVFLWILLPFFTLSCPILRQGLHHYWLGSWHWWLEIWKRGYI